MAAEITDITERNQDDMESLLSTVAEIAERTRRMEADLHRMIQAWSAGGLRGLRQAAQIATRARPVAGCPHEPACLNAALCLSARGPGNDY